MEKIMNMPPATRNRTLPYLTGLFFDGISSGLFMMALPWMMLQTPDMGTFVALTALTCTAVAFLFAPIFATIVDRHSRKKILVVNQAVQAMTAFAIALIYSFGLTSPWLLAAAQLIFWLSSNLGWNSNNAFTQENYQRHEYAAISGKQEIVLQMTTLGAGGLGVMLLELWGVREFALFAATSSLIATLCYAVTPYRRQLRQTSSGHFWHQVTESRAIFAAKPRLFAIVLLSCLSYPVVTFLGKLVPIWFAENRVSGHWFASYSIAFGVGALLTGLFIQRLLSKRPYATTIFYAMVALTIALIGMSLFNDPLSLIILTLVFGFFNALNRIAKTNWMHHTIAIEQRGRVDGGLAMFSTLVQSLSYLLIALLSAVASTELGFVSAAVVIAAASVAIYMLTKPLSITVTNSRFTSP
ncbi:MFS transporter [Vibrio vulnificus]|uniref:MFS transporter n=1 Tax=Vibrio vulnificus TaxID=672 RepID=UPI000CD26BAC|nr:MFS transporter [Vibrio vulnificus]EHD1696612.1 MFS transporter [Vibrio vulnificus]EHU4974383.1 MFS transporter [Vibrio vulnificus]MCU8444996.1 MFS transporter [Vibrio vulnificus]POC40428.1 MFS transporter [Vibrio vulnificus]POC53371.1 MFS transporter [Vibrio vulnificus]